MQGAPGASSVATVYSQPAEGSARQAACLAQEIDPPASVEQVAPSIELLGPHAGFAGRAEKPCRRPARIALCGGHPGCVRGPTAA